MLSKSQDGTMRCICAKGNGKKTVIVTGYDLPTTPGIFYKVYGKSGVSKKGNAFFESYNSDICPPKDEKSFIA